MNIKHRSDLRLAIGMQYFRLKRHLKWCFGQYKFAKQHDHALIHEHYRHHTPLYRKLKDVDMYLQENKVINLSLALPRVQNITIYPGEIFSYWKTIGMPTKTKGYKPGMVLKRGKVTEGTGGGLCQLSNMIYWMTLHTPLTVVERHRHGYDVFPDSNRTQPFGSGATCFYNYGDLMIANETVHAFQLKLYMDNTHLHGAWMSAAPQQHHYEVYEKDHIMKSEYWGGHTRHNVLHRRVYNLEHKQVGDEFVTENHAIMMYNPFIADKNSSA